MFGGALLSPFPCSTQLGPRNPTLTIKCFSAQFALNVRQFPIMIPTGFLPTMPTFPLGRRCASLRTFLPA